MVTLTFIFWAFVVIFGVIGTMRGWAKELLVSFAVILSLALNRLLERYVPVINTMELDSPALFWIRTIILLVLVFFGYQTIALPRLAGKAAREQLQDALLGVFLGAINGYLIVGTLWFYLHQANYPFEYIMAPLEGTPLGDAALDLLTGMPPRLLGEPGIYFAVILAFIFVLVVFI
jgi:uncharacterized membrane protein required for colicin V production